MRLTVVIALCMTSVVSVTSFSMGNINPGSKDGDSAENKLGSLSNSRIFGCWYNGQYHNAWSTFPAMNGCDTCSCRRGTAVCTTDGCAACKYGFTYVSSGTTVPALDGCNSCTCFDGDFTCTTDICRCDDPDFDSSTVVNAPSNLLGAVAVYTCAEGYSDMVGVASRVCIIGGQWTGSAPTCSLIDCGAPDAIDGTEVSAPSHLYGSVATYTCASGYIDLTGSDSRTCQADGTWSGSAPSCIEECNSGKTDLCSSSDTYKLRSGTGCQEYCQCAPLSTAADGTISYYWQSQSCAPGTLWDMENTICNHAYAVTCEA